MPHPNMYWSLLIYATFRSEIGTEIWVESGNSKISPTLNQGCFNIDIEHILRKIPSWIMQQTVHITTETLNIYLEKSLVELCSKLYTLPQRLIDVYDNINDYHI